MNRLDMLDHLARHLRAWPRGCVEAELLEPGHGWQWYDEAPSCDLVLCRGGSDGVDEITERDWMEARWVDGEGRIDRIAQSDASGDHYRQGRKDDAAKPRMDLLLADMPHALEAVARVLTHGAEKYAPGNWQHVPDAQRRYLAAGARHELELAKGMSRDAETGEHHLAHKLCCDLFRLELLLREES